MICYVVYHSIAENTLFGYHGIMRGIYFFILITHICLSFIIVLALFTLIRGFSMQVERHKNRQMDDAALAVCQSDGRHCILNDLTVLLKAVLCAAFSID